MRKNITANSNGTVSYVQVKSYVFDREMSVGDAKEDKFITINIPQLVCTHALVEIC